MSDTTNILPNSQTSPTEGDSLGNPQSLVDAALSPAPVAPTIADPLPPVAPPTFTAPTLPEPPVTPATPTPAVSMGDDTPLAFVASAPAATTPENGSPIPPISPQATEPKKKSKMLVGLTSAFILMIGMVSGLYAFAQYKSKNVEISPITSSVKKITSMGDPYDDALRDGINAKKSGKSDEEIEEIVQQSFKDSATANSGFGDIQAVISDEASTLLKKTITFEEWVSDYNLQKELASSIAKQAIDTATDTMCNKYWDASKYAYGDPKRLEGAGGNPCDVNGCSLTADLKTAGCVIQDVRCNGGGNVGVACNENIISESQDDADIADLKCGSQQIDVVCKDLCGTKPIAFSNKITGINCKTTTTTEFSPSPSPSSASSMSCTGITSTPATNPAPVVGDKLTFTCAGVVTPSTAGVLSYKFRYSINSGAVTTLANKTTTTAELSIAACGTYKVECQACATLNGVLTCDPIWTGATQ